MTKRKEIIWYGDVAATVLKPSRIPERLVLVVVTVTVVVIVLVRVRTRCAVR
jgi:hypothetical protein